MFTQEEILEMARQAGFEDFDKWVEHYPKETKKWCERMEAFAKLVAAAAASKEREKCWEIACDFTQRFNSHVCLKVADEIRARGEAQ